MNESAETSLVAVLLGVLVGHLRGAGASLPDIQTAVSAASEGYDAMAAGDARAWDEFSGRVKDAIAEKRLLP